MNSEFIWPIRVYYEDTDAGGVVYYANYLKFYERARSEWLNALNIDQLLLLSEKVAFVVRKAEIDYIKPARLNDSLQIITRIKRLKAVSIDFEQQISIIKSGFEPELINKVKIKVACLNIESFIPCRIPIQVKEELQRVS
ncbi:MAG: tol-pal system-associated acyl-CoA thioesterase [Gammaproteobacteria bacterium]|nr:MAG: tol-pal system-associated acyl-CoA thioesterase [Gammaproteobacteria bacterium]